MFGTAHRVRQETASPFNGCRARPEIGLILSRYIEILLARNRAHWFIRAAEFERSVREATVAGDL
jgi:hypothetical protein